MFTGIVTDVGRLLRTEDRNDGRNLRIGTAYDPQSIDLGASITVDGICLTVTDKGRDEGAGNWFEVFAALETLGVTEVGRWHENRRINLERSLKIGDELGGHIVSGHIDGLATIIGKAEEVNDASYTRTSTVDGKETEETIQRWELSLTIPGMRDRVRVNLAPEVLPNGGPDTLDKWELEETWVNVSADSMRTVAFEGSKGAGAIVTFNAVTVKEATQQERQALQQARKTSKQQAKTKRAARKAERDAAKKAAKVAA